MEYLTGKAVRVFSLPEHLEKKVGRFYTREQKVAGIPAKIVGTNGKNMYMLRFDRVEPPEQGDWLFFRGEFEIEAEAVHENQT